jgi:hypothetical protein
MRERLLTGCMHGACPHSRHMHAVFIFMIDSKIIAVDIHMHVVLIFMTDLKITIGCRSLLENLIFMAGTIN